MKAWSVHATPKGAVGRGTKPCDVEETSSGPQVHAGECGPSPRSYAKLRIPGLQEFAGQQWLMRRRVPKSVFKDPLERLFEDFDEDGNGVINLSELVAALQSKSVEITEEQARELLHSADTNCDGAIDLAEFKTMIFALAKQDLMTGAPSSGDPG
eukprot:scaffold128_cov328-Pavlova_lutheri.AAC.60